MKPTRAPIRLATHLLLTHTLPLLLLLVALGATIYGLSRMTRAMSEILAAQLGSVDAEEELHRAAWGIEVAVRHERAACELHRDRHDVGESIARARRHLDEVMLLRRSLAPARFVHAADSYLALADRATAAHTCEALLDHELDRARSQLDEELTNIWIERLHELHGALVKREEGARKTGSIAIAVGLFGGLFSWLAAAGVARATARAVTAPLATIGQLAARLGEGNFAPLPTLRGTREVVDLARELERMRVRLLELDQLKRGFIASVSHELRTPLAKIREALSLLADGTVGEPNPGQARVITLARRACEREVHIVSTLLDLSRMRSGGGLAKEPVPLDRVIEAVVREEQPDPDERDVRIEVERLSPVPRLDIDASLVERSIANLVRNAVSVSQAGQRVRVRCARSQAGPRGDREHDWVTITVEDEGPGVPPAIRPTLFSEFASSPVSTRGGARGVGLGLAFSREVARVHGGDVQLADSERGARFVLWLPDAPASSTESSRSLT